MFMETRNLSKLKIQKTNASGYLSPQGAERYSCTSLTPGAFFVLGGSMAKRKKTPIKRKPITKKLRFEVFKRDGFQCAYCGQTPPAVTLEIDHVEPHSKSVSDELFLWCLLEQNKQDREGTLK